MVTSIFLFSTPCFASQNTATRLNSPRQQLFKLRVQLASVDAAIDHAAVFADKDIGRAKPIVPDFIGLTLPNRFVFGFGMDVKGAWRNLPAIYATKEK